MNISISKYNSSNNSGNLHPECKCRYEEWEYLTRSYRGGQDYRNGNYLKKYAREENKTGNQYIKRLKNTPYCNYVRSTIQTYRGFLSDQTPQRILDFGGEITEAFMDDCDRMGTNLTNFMLDCNDKMVLYGHAWIIVDRTAETEDGRYRTYLAQYSPLDVLDWEGDEKSGYSYLKLIENRGRDTITVLEYTPETITRKYYKKDLMSGTVINGVMNFGKEIDEKRQVLNNELKEIPVIKLFNSPDMGCSRMIDIADHACSIYNLLSESEQTIRLNIHATLVKNKGDRFGAGAGGILTLDDQSDKLPYLLSPGGTTTDSIIRTIEMHEEMIDKLAHLSGIRGTKSTAMSGIALTTERQNLNATLSQFTDNIIEAEIKVWKLWAKWENITLRKSFSVVYPKDFNVRDKQMEAGILDKVVTLLEAVSAIPENGIVKETIMNKALELLIDDERELDTLKEELKTELNSQTQFPDNDLLSEDDK